MISIRSLAGNSWRGKWFNFGIKSKPGVEIIIGKYYSSWMIRHLISTKNWIISWIKCTDNREDKMLKGLGLKIERKSQ